METISPLDVTCAKAVGGVAGRGGGVTNFKTVTATVCAAINA